MKIEKAMFTDSVATQKSLVDTTFSKFDDTT